MKIRKIIGALIGAALCLFAFGCDNKPSLPSDGDDNETERPLIAQTLNFEESSHSEKVNWYGRCYHDKEKARVSISNASVGFEVAFYGTELKATIAATVSSYKAPELSGNGYVCVFLDGETKYENAKVIELTDSSGAAAEISLVENLEKGKHTVRVVKITEAKYTQAYVHSVFTDGEFETPPSKPEIKLELIGDSITVGANAVRKSIGDETGTDSENSLASYGAVAARMLNAQISVAARSGLTVAGGDTGVRFAKIADYYSVYGEFDSAEWDFSQYVPDAVVVDLGTNDKGVNTSDSKIEQAYTSLLLTIREKYPQAHIFCCTGAMGDSVAEIAAIVDNMLAKLGDARMYHVELYETSTVGHPTAQQHTTNGIRLYAQIKAKLGL